MFFSSAILGGHDGKGMSAETATLLVGVVNFVSTAIGMTLLSKFGRKSIMVAGMIGITLMLIGTGVF
jgi:hypothetical protein